MGGRRSPKSAKGTTILLEKRTSLTLVAIVVSKIIMTPYNIESSRLGKPYKLYKQRLQLQEEANRCRFHNEEIELEKSGGDRNTTSVGVNIIGGVIHLLRVIVHLLQLPQILQTTCLMTIPLHVPMIHLFSRETLVCCLDICTWEMRVILPVTLLPKKNKIRFQKRGLPNPLLWVDSKAMLKLLKTLICLIQQSWQIQQLIYMKCGRMTESENRSTQQPSHAHTCRITFLLKNRDDDTFNFSMRGLLRPASWLGNYTESAIAAMAGVRSRYYIRKSEPHLLLLRIPSFADYYRKPLTELTFLIFVGVLELRVERDTYVPELLGDQTYSSIRILLQLRSQNVF
nr:hypothetical protein [Tanacetum cinerariifolium]